jgi:hypothetical protein
MSDTQPRGVLPDAVTTEQVVLFKTTPYLRLTYEIRMATLMAASSGRELLLVVPRATRFSAELKRFVAHQGVAVRKVRAT